MTGPSNVVDLVTKAVLERVQGRVDAAVEEARRRAQAELDEFIAGLPESIAGEVVELTAEDPRADARNRAARTAVQGAVATVLLAVALAVSGAIGGDFDFTSGGDWKALAGAAIGAAVAAGAAYVQRIVSPPRPTGERE